MRPLWIFVVCAGVAIGQEQKHLTAVPVNGLRPVILSADGIQRNGPYPSTIHLTGNVEIKTPVCLPVGANGKPVCDGYTLLKADEATYNEASGEIEARGTVKLTPLLHEK